MQDRHPLSINIDNGRGRKKLKDGKKSKSFTLRLEDSDMHEFIKGAGGGSFIRMLVKEHIEKTISPYTT